MSRLFSRFAEWCSTTFGHAKAFVVAVVVVVVWLVSGPLFGFSDTWQLVINTGTTIVTFLMVFLVQNAQNRSSESLTLKLTCLILADPRIGNRWAEVDDMTDEELHRLRQELIEERQSVADTR